MTSRTGLTAGKGPAHRSCAARCACAVLLAALPVTAGAGERFWSFEWYQAQKQGFAGPVDYEESGQRLVHVVRGASAAEWVLGHEYRIFGQPPVGGATARSNGHMHAISAQWRKRHGGWEVRIAPTLATSSNRVFRPQAWTAADWRVDGALLRVAADGAHGGWRAGFVADARFGSYRVYPVVAWETVAGPLRAVLGWPDGTAEWQVAPTLALTLAAGPDGGEWTAGDRDDPSFATEIAQRRWRTALELRWQMGGALRLTAGAARFVGHTWRYHLSDGRVTELELPDDTAFVARLVLAF
ncbi:MAG TPA: hypothetical protein VNL72_00530 [Gammaproteobacteria bacterium]|nr:hypothetical protein [Gammaproteobacteria bacterium]